MFAEAWARPLLVVHAVVACAAVASATHAALWLRRHLRDGSRLRATRRFGTITAALFALAFVGGLVIYPTYRTRVRAELLDDPIALTAMVDAEATARAARGEPLPPPEVRAARAEARVADAARAARWFDVKEYLALVGLLLALAVAVILRAWTPEAAPAIGGITLGLALATAACGWATGVIGLLTTAWRGV
ncbi:MAG: hypothetical protein R2939_00835 [Kofleriaceae bacterium]